MEVRTKRPPRLPASDRFEFHEPIAVGGAGTVYRGLDRQTGDAVAIKVLKLKVSENQVVHQRLVREFRAASQLEHPNIVRAIAFENDGETSYVVYELVDGGTLIDRIERDGPIPEADAVRIVTQVAQALHYAHQHLVVHRDVKPENILLLPDGRAKLTDFGLAKDHGNGTDEDLTRHASTLGTPHYMAPEQFADARTAGPLCDVYSLGATLYSVLTGVLPFDAKFPLAILAKKESGQIPSARAIVPAVSERTDAAIRAALQPDPSRRPSSCLELFRLLTTSPRPATRPAKPPGRRADLRTQTRFNVRLGGYGVIDASLAPTEEGEERWPLVVQDLSAEGVGILLARRFEPGTALDVELNDGSDKPRRVPARVVRVQPEQAGHWFHGCAFEPPLSEAEVDQFLEFD